MVKIVRMVLCIGYLVQIPLGYSAAFLYHTELWGWHRRAMAKTLLHQDDIPTHLMPVVEQLCAMLGATIACWGLLCAWVVIGPLARREKWSWWALFVSLWAWGSIDTALSMHHGAWFNVLFNACPLIVVTLCLFLVYRDIFHPSPP